MHEKKFNYKSRDCKTPGCSCSKRSELIFLQTTFGKSTALLPFFFDNCLQRIHVPAADRMLNTKVIRIGKYPECSWCKDVW